MKKTLIIVGLVIVAVVAYSFINNKEEIPLEDLMIDRGSGEF